MCWACIGVVSIPGSPARAQEPVDDPGSIATVEAMESEEAAGPNVDRQRLPAPPPPRLDTSAEETGPNRGRIHLTLGLDVTNAYFARGIRQEDRGVVFQPYASLALDVYRGSEFSLQANVNTWSSVHSKATNAVSTDDLLKRWYEQDVAFGVTATIDQWTVGVQYLWPTSPNGAFETTDEFDLTLAYDDAELLGAYKLCPSVLLAVETGSATGDGVRPTGAYLQLGVCPGFDAELDRGTTLAISFPAQVGLSLSNYYQDSGGRNDLFGFAALGVKGSLPLPVHADFGAWSLSVGVSAQFLSGVCADLNNGSSFEVVGTAGVAVEY